MTGKVLFAMGKKLTKTVASTVLEGVSAAGDKVAEMSDEAKGSTDIKLVDSALDSLSYIGDKLSETSDEVQEWVESLDKKDLTGREKRKSTGTFSIFED